MASYSSRIVEPIDVLKHAGCCLQPTVSLSLAAMSSAGLYTCRGQGLVSMCQPERLYPSECPGNRCNCMNEKPSRVRDSHCTKVYCRCGAPRVPTLNHLFITEDLTKVPPRLKYDKSKYRRVHVDGRTYFLLQSDHAGPLWTDEHYRSSRKDQSVLNNSGRTVRGEFICSHRHCHEHYDEQCLEDNRDVQSHPGIRPTAKRVLNSKDSPVVDGVKVIPNRNSKAEPSGRVPHHMIVPRHRRSHSCVGGSGASMAMLRETGSWGNSNGRHSRPEILNAANGGYHRRRPGSQTGKSKSRKPSRDRRIKETMCWRTHKNDTSERIIQNKGRTAVVVGKDQVRRTLYGSRHSKGDLIEAATVCRSSTDDAAKQSKKGVMRDVQEKVDLAVTKPLLIEPSLEKTTLDAQRTGNGTQDGRKSDPASVRADANHSCVKGYSDDGSVKIECRLVKGQQIASTGSEHGCVTRIKGTRDLVKVEDISKDGCDIVKDAAASERKE